MIYLLMLLAFNETNTNNETTNETPAPTIPIYQRAHDLLSANKFYQTIDQDHTEEKILTEFFENVGRYLHDLENKVVGFDETNQEKIRNYSYHLAGIWIDSIPIIQNRVQGNRNLERDFAHTTISIFNVTSNLLRRASFPYDAYEFERFLTEIWAGTSFEPNSYYDLINVLIEAEAFEAAIAQGEAFLLHYASLCYRGETRVGYLGVFNWVAEAARLNGQLDKSHQLRNESESLKRQTVWLENFRITPEVTQNDTTVLIENHLRLLVEPALSR